MSSRTTETPECRCLACGHRLDRATGYDHADLPAEGDVTVCIRCGAVMAFSSDLTVRGMTDLEIDAVASDTELIKQLRRIVTTVHFIRSIRN